MIRVELVYAEPQRSFTKQLELPQGSTLADALGAIPIGELGVPDWDLAGAAVGIFGKLMPREQLLKDGDRIEIYRPLAEEPKLARRKRASRQASKRGRS